MTRRSIVICAILLLAIGGTLTWRLLPVRKTFYTDADTIKAPKAAAVLRQILWQPPQRLPDMINTSGEDYEPRIAADGMTLLFVRHKAGDNADIYFSRKHATGWSEPMALTGVNSENDDLGPVLSHDGRTMYFYSNRSGSLGGYDLWVAHRRADDTFEFEEPVNLGLEVNSSFNEYGPALTPDGDILYFSSNRPRPEDKEQPNPNAWSATLREDLYQRTYDLYASVINERGASAARPLSALNTASNEGAPAVSPVGDFLYFASDRSGGEGGFDLYRSRRLHGSHEAAHSLGKTVNSTANDLDPSLGTGGYGLYFSSDRVDGAAGAGSDESREYNLYQTASREVFVDSEALARSPINWAALWSALWPNLLWLLIALTLAALLLTLLRQSEEKRLSLLMRCLLGSVLAHLVLVMILTIWGVSSSIAGEFSRRGKIQVSLASTAGGESVFSQITGGLTSVEVPTLEVPSPSRADAPSEPLEKASEARLDVQHQEIPVASTPQVAMTMTDATTDWSPQVDHTELPKILEPASVDVPVTTPNESVRMSVREFEQAMTPTEATPDTARRPEVVMSAQPSQSVTVAPTSSDSVDAQAVMRQSLVEQVPTAGATPTPDSLRGSPVSPSPNHVPPTPGIRLAVATVERLPEVSEFQIDPSDRTVQVPALRVADVAETDALDDAQASLVPEATSNSEALDGGLDGHALTQVADAVPQAESAPVDLASIELPIPDGAVPDVSAPQESTQIAGVVEADGNRATTPIPQAIRATSASLVSERSAPTIDQLDPDRSDTTGVEESIMAQLENQAADRSLPELALGEAPVAQLDAIPASASPDVSVPADTVQVASTTEPIDPVTSAMNPEALRPNGTFVDTNRTSTKMSEFNPDQFQTAVADALMAPNYADMTTDENVPDMPIVEQAIPSLASAQPELELVNLPAVEVTEAVHAPESRDRVEAVDLVDVRATMDSWISQSVRETYEPDVESAVSPSKVTVASLDVSLVTDQVDSDHVVPVVPVSYESPTPIELPDTFELQAMDLELSTEESAPENAFVQRQAPNKLDIVKQMGGSEETEEAVALALKWLAEHQDDDGYWDVRVYDKRCGGCDETKAISANVALTGLATLCFLGAGHTQDTDGPYQDNVERAIDWLLDQQSDNGDLRGKETMYTQGIASIALAEALAMTGDERLREPVEVAMRFIYAARNRREGGWRYDPGQDGDTSVLGWMMMAMKSASTSGLPVPRDAFEAGGDWLNRVSDPNRPGLYKYRPERDVTPSMTAEAMFIQQLLGKTSSDPIMQASAQYIIEHLPDWDDDPNTYFWYYASLAMFQHQGPAWTTWNEALKGELIEHQRRDGRAAGSWDPQGNEWSELGGRVYQTALCTLMLEVYYRYLPMYSNDDPTIPERPADAVGTIAGVVRDAETGQPLVGASVRLDVPGGEPIMATTDRDGFYYLWAPELPPFFALSAAHEGYVPESENVNSTELRESVLDVDFALHSDQGEVLVTEAMPEVHHLGDNRFEGKINSQFQKEAEGAEYGSEFVLTPQHLTRRFRRAEVRLMVKGVQRAHSLFINGTLLDTKLDEAPDDGSFGEFRARFDLQLLRPGSNTVDLVAKPSSSDIDDFEFVNVQIHLLP